MCIIKGSNATVMKFFESGSGFDPKRTEPTLNKLSDYSNCMKIELETWDDVQVPCCCFKLGMG